MRVTSARDTSRPVASLRTTRSAKPRSPDHPPSPPNPPNARTTGDDMSWVTHSSYALVPDIVTVTISQSCPAMLSWRPVWIWVGTAASGSGSDAAHVYSEYDLLDGSIEYRFRAVISVMMIVPFVSMRARSPFILRR